MNRRTFFDASRMAQSAGQLLGPWLDLPQISATPADEVSLLRFSRRAMATTFELLLPFAQSYSSAHAAAVFDEIEALEAQLTVYQDDSEVSLLNRRAAAAAVPVEQRLFELLQLAARVTTETGNAFDVTAGPLIKAWGFFRRQGRVPTPTERQGALQRVGMRYVVLDPASRTVRYLRQGIEINLGSIGKGYALDQAAELLRGRGVQSALLHGGGSSVLAFGSQTTDRRGWPVGIRHPWLEGQSLGTVHLHKQALGTSAATFQHFAYNKKKLGHVLDPRTGWPAEGIASASVVAPKAAEADALATAFYVLGVDKTRLFCQSRPEIGAILLPEGEDARPVVFNLTPELFTPAGPEGLP